MKNIASRKKNSKPLLIEGTFRDERPDLFNDRTHQKCASGLDASWSKMKHMYVCNLYLMLELSKIRPLSNNDLSLTFRFLKCDLKSKT